VSGANVKPGVLELALGYVAAGLCVLPIKPDGSKAPALASWDEFKARLPTEAEVRRWFAAPKPLGVAIVGGAVSGGLLVLDFEFLDFHEEWAALVEAQAPGLVARLPLVRTPGKEEAGGRHTYVRTSGSPVGTGKLARVTRAEAQRRTGDPGRITAVEVKAEKGYVLTCGSPAACHPSGRTYEHVGGPPITETPTLDAVEVNLLLACARALERGDKAAADRRQSAAATPDELRPGDDFNRRANWLDVLGPDWKTVREQGEVIYVCRPGKEAGVSATIGYCKSARAGPKLYVFSTNAEPFEAEKSYSKFEAYTALNHFGDFKAAARELARQGYGDGGRQGAHAKATVNGAPPPTAGPADPGPSAGPATAAEIILDFWKEHYDPTFHRGASIYSAKLGREVKGGEVQGRPTSVLIERLALASDAPRSKDGSVARDGLPNLYRNWCQVAWGDLLAELPDETESPELVRAAREEFRAKVVAGLKMFVNLGEVHERGKGEATAVERRPLILWAVRFAKSNGPRWGDVRGYAIWSRTGETGVQVSIRVEVFEQIHYRGLAGLTHRRFSDLAQMYEVGRPCKVEGGETRAVELLAEFLQELLAAPVSEEPGQTDAGSRACARA
jgi:putative DNA primase/helicase